MSLGGKGAAPRDRIVVLGAAGQVGHELCRSLLPLGDVVAIGRADVDLAQPQNLLPVLERQRPACVVNAAAYTAVDRAEQEPDLAYAVNAALPALLARESVRMGFRLVHYSTDYVFDGQRPEDARALREDDPVAPRSVYGRSKLEGEQAVLGGPDALVFRLSWVFGLNGGNFVKTMLRLAAERDRLRVVNDQHGCPTPATLVADITLLALHARLNGLYHLCGAGPTTWHDYARTAIARAHELGWTGLRTSPEAVDGIPTSDYPTPAARPAWSVMDTSRLEQALGLRLPGWLPYLDRLLTALRPPAG